MKNSSNSSTKRATAFRDRLAGHDIKRWEIFASSQTRAAVREIAKRENLSPGVAAEALLSLGIEAYHSGSATAVGASDPVAVPDTSTSPVQMSAAEFQQLQAKLGASEAVLPVAAINAFAAFAPVEAHAAAASLSPGRTFSGLSGSLAAYSARGPALMASSQSRPVSSSAATALAADLTKLISSKKG